jgi:OmpA-OmpF porin, OOP family
MRSLALIVAGLTGIGILTYLCGNHHGPHFAADLSARTEAALKTGGIAPVQVAGEGQIVTLSGQVASADMKARAEAEAYRIDGVEQVRNLLTVAPPGSPPPQPLSAAERVEAVNCQKVFTALLRAEKIRFQSGKAVISPISYKLLDRLAEAAGKCPAARIQVEGHTDSSGAREMNMTLSRSRATAVVDYLKRKGVASSRLTSEGLGPDRPLTDNKTPAGREQNRRTEFKVPGL